MTKIPFNLERALAGDLCVDDNGVEYKLVYQSTLTNNLYLFIRFYNSAEESIWINVLHEKLYLSMKPKKKTYWTNVYKHDDGTIYTSRPTYNSWEDAVDSSSSNTIKTISFEVEE